MQSDLLRYLNEFFKDHTLDDLLDRRAGKHGPRYGLHRVSEQAYFTVSVPPHQHGAKPCLRINYYQQVMGFRINANGRLRKLDTYLIDRDYAGDRPEIRQSQDESSDDELAQLEKGDV